MEVGCKRHIPGHFIPGKNTVTILQDGEWSTGSVWNGAENLAPTGIRSSDRPFRNYAS